MGKPKFKSPPDKIPCPCGKKQRNKKAWLTITMPRTTYDGRTCSMCGQAVLTCHWCYGILCDWKQGEPNSECSYIPNHCTHCGRILHTRGF